MCHIATTGWRCDRDLGPGTSARCRFNLGVLASALRSGVGYLASSCAELSPPRHPSKGKADRSHFQFSVPIASASLRSALTASRIYCRLK
ncbi:hypothetical protein VTJ04DRAFT_6408 [Mycothermus thermophilus]|uniref:uncharacterized protein n=1 Tax=Humicola insolens TaxID=85995 RepID=UPI003741EC37